MLSVSHSLGAWPLTLSHMFRASPSCQWNSAHGLDSEPTVASLRYLLLEGSPLHGHYQGGSLAQGCSVPSRASAETGPASWSSSPSSLFAQEDRGEGLHLAIRLSSLPQLGPTQRLYPILVPIVSYLGSKLNSKSSIDYQDSLFDITLQFFEKFPLFSVAK